MSHPLGQPVRLTWATFSDIDETTPADPTALTLTVTKPDATTTLLHWPTPAEITRDSLGVFHYDYTGATAGTYLFRWVASGAVSSTGTGQFDVDPQTRYIVSLEDAKAILNDTNMNDERTAKLQTFVAGATKVIEHLCTIIVPRAVTEYPHVYGGLVALDNRHVVSVESVHEGVNGVLTELVEDDFATAGAAYGYRRKGSLIYRRASGVDCRFTPGADVRVIYTPGMDPVTEDVRLAAEELIRFWWQPSQLGVLNEAGPLGAAGTGTVSVLGFLVPNAVKALLNPYGRGPEVA